MRLLLLLILAAPVRAADIRFGSPASSGLSATTADTDYLQVDGGNSQGLLTVTSSGTFQDKVQVKGLLTADGGYVGSGVLTNTGVTTLGGGQFTVTGASVGIRNLAPVAALHISTGFIRIDGQSGATTPMIDLRDFSGNRNAIRMGNGFKIIWINSSDVATANSEIGNDVNNRMTASHTGGYRFTDYATGARRDIDIASTGEIGFGRAGSAAYKFHFSSGTLLVDGSAPVIQVGDANNAGSLIISSGTAIRNFLMGATTADCPSVTLATVGICSFAATGVNIGDNCSVQADALEANLSVSISSASTAVIAIRLNNPTIGNIDPGSQSYRWWCVRP